MTPIFFETATTTQKPVQTAHPPIPNMTDVAVVKAKERKSPLEILKYSAQRALAGGLPGAWRAMARRGLGASGCARMCVCVSMTRPHPRHAKGYQTRARGLKLCRGGWATLPLAPPLPWIPCHAPHAHRVRGAVCGEAWEVA